jgi:nitrogen fixation/metabolism regulation signal transduction histidine kinase
MATRTLKRGLYGAAVVSGLGLAVFALFLLGQTAQNSEDFDRLHLVILSINGIGVVLLTVILILNLARLIRDYRQHVPGSRLKARMVGMFVGLAVLPLFVVFYFSIQFINRSIDSWFNVQVEAGFDNALSLSRAALEMQMRDRLETTLDIARTLEIANGRQLIFELSALRRQSGAHEITIYGRNSQIVATSFDQTSTTLPAPPRDEVLLQIRQSRPYVSLDPLETGSFEIRAAVPFQESIQNSSSVVLQALYPVPERIGRMANSVDSSYSDYKRLVYLREPLKRTFTLTLTVVLMVSMLASIYGAFFFSRRLVAPIQNLVAGTRAVAEGDFDTRLETPSRDEIGFLISSFNEMTRRLSSARQQASLSQAQVEAERANLEIILASLSTGVISLEHDLRIRTANDAAGAILNVDFDQNIGKSLDEIAEISPLLEQFVDVAKVHISANETAWREQIVLRGEVGRRVLTCACTRLPEDHSEGGGFVIVFDDITALLQAQRDAAWGEVARRLAHEIKNPLTPIQLSAERLRKKYLDTMTPDQAQVLDRATHTIVQQVEAMKEMVNAFSDYARAPEMEVTRFDLKTLVNEVSDLYRTQESGVELVVSMDSAMPEIEADIGRIRQILHNLVSNSVEALEHSPQGKIFLTTDFTTLNGIPVAEIVVEDNGPGFQAGVVNQAFDPYVTTKAKGTGLGLAIVKKLVEEHAGTIDATNRKDGGAMIRIFLPINEAAREAMMAMLPGRADTRRERA